MHSRIPPDALVLLEHVHLSTRYPYLYVDTPKTGCSSIKKTLNLAERAGVSALLSKSGATELGYSSALLKVHDRKLMPLTAPANLDELQTAAAVRPVRFCFVRNPFTRVLSAYIDKIESNPQRRALFMRGFADSSAVDGRTLSFPDFLSLVREQSIGDMNPHWRPQTHQTMWSLIDYTHVGAFERLDEDLHRILSSIDPDLVAFISIVSEHRTATRERWMYYYSEPGTRDMALEIYADDFSTFGYSSRLEDALLPPRVEIAAVAECAPSRRRANHLSSLIEIPAMGDSASEFQCNVCGCNASSQSASRADGAIVVYCDHCGMGMIEDVPADLSIYYDNDYYGSSDNSANDAGYSNYAYMAEHGVSWAAALLDAMGLNGRLLDVGCADGHLLKKLASRFSLFGIEVNTDAASKAAQAGIRIISTDLLDNRLLGEFACAFDVVTSIATFEHLADFRGGVRRTIELLKDEGVLLFEVPLISTQCDNHVWYTSSFEHVYYPTERSLHHLFEEELGVPMLGTALHIKGYGCTYLGIASPSVERLQRLKPAWSRITGSGNGELSPGERRARAVLRLLHAAQADIDYLDDVRFLRDEDVTRQTLVRMASLWQAQVCDDRENRRRLEARVETSTAQIRKLESTLNEVSDASAWHAAQAQRWQDEYHAAVAVYEGALELAHVARRTQAVTEYPPGQASAPTGKDWLWIAANPLLATKLAVLKRIDRLSVRSPRASSALRSTVRHTWWLMTLQWGRSTKEQDLVPARHRGQADERDQKPTADREKKKLGAPLEITVAPHKQGAPLVSIVIPCFNYGRFIKEAVSSAAAQTFKDLEIIVVEGGSTDGTTRKVVQTLSGPNLNVLFRNQAHRVGDNRNFGIAHARGKYICCLDADDRLHPTYIEKAVYMLERHGYDLISTSVQMFGESELRYGVSDEVDLEVLMQANPITTCALFRRDLWEAAGGFRDYGDGTPATHLHEDWGFWMRLAALGARMTNFSRDHLFYYRVHGTPSLSRNPDILPMDQQGQALRDANADILTKKALLRSKHRRFTPVHVSDGLVNLVRKPWKPNARTMLMALPFTVLGGAERLLSAVVRHLTKAGWDISIIKSIEPAKAAGDTTEWFSASTAQIYDLPKFLAEDNWNDFIDYLIQTKGVSKVWIIGSEFVYHLLPTLKRKYPGLLCVDLLFNTVGHTANNRRYATLIDRILVENNEVQSWLVERGENPSRITTITSGVNLTEFKPREKSLSLLQALAIKPSGLLVGFSGRWSDEKDPIAFVRIAARLVNLAPLDDVYFIMTGTGPLKRAILKELATLPELNNRFHIMENVSDIRDVLASFDVLVLPSRLDGRPVVVLEALASGVPVVASRVGALPELIDPGRTGELCDPGDYDGFAAALAGVNENRRLLQQMKRNARAFAEQYLDEQDMLERYRHALEAVEPHPLTKPSEGGITT